MDRIDSIVTSTAANSALLRANKAEFTRKERYDLGTAIVEAFPPEIAQPRSREIARKAIEAIITAANELQISEFDLLDESKLTTVASELAKFMRLTCQNKQTKIVERALIYARGSKLSLEIIKERVKNLDGLQESESVLAIYKDALPDLDPARSPKILKP